MNYILEGIKEAFILIFSGDPEIYSIIALSLLVSLMSVLLASIIALPLGIVTGLKDFFGKKMYVRLMYTLMGMPPVVLGLMVYLVIARRGPLGYLSLMYTPTAMVIAQTLLILPVITGNIYNSVMNNGLEISLSCKTLGASKFQTLIVLIKELRTFILVALVTGFGRAISAVGAIFMVGGNISGKTRTMTTFIMLSNSKGDISLSIAMGLVLILIAFIVTSILHRFIGEYD